MFEALIISSVFLFGFALLFMAAFRLAFGKGFIKNHFTKWQLAIFAVLAIVSLFAVIHISSKNSGIYAWDSGGYWVWSYQHTDKLFSAPNDAMQDLGESIIQSDYNLILPTVISLPMKIFGNTFLRFACINYILFFVPAMFVLLCLFMKISDKSKNQNRAFLVSILSLASLSVPLICILQGYIDVAILIPITLIFAITLSYNPLKSVRGQIGKGLMIGTLLAVTFLFRRYAAFFVVGYAITMVVYCVYMLIINRKDKKIKDMVRSVFLNALCVIIPPAIILLGFFSGLIFRILGENYAELYSAYSDTFTNKVLGVILHFGIIIILLAVIGAVVSFVKKKNQKIAFFALFSFITIAILFFRVQRMDGHHIYTITPQILILLFLSLSYLFSIKKKLIIKVLCVILLAIGSLSCLSSHVFKLTKPVSAAFQLHYENVLHRDDIETIHTLRDYLNGIKRDNKMIYVLSSSVYFNSDTLMVMERPAKDNAVDGLVKSHDVDLRDGFPANVFFDSNIIVTTNPVGTHLLEGSQQVITYLAEQIQDSNSYIGMHYTKDPLEFQIINGYTVYIYYLTSDYTAEDYDKLRDYYDNLYPEQKEIFKNRIEDAKNKHLN